MSLGFLAKPGSLAFFLGALSGAASAADISDPLEVHASPQRLVILPDGRRMNLHCLGEGGPTVVFDAGWSEQPDVAW
jgi:hypothetical protein